MFLLILLMVLGHFEASAEMEIESTLVGEMNLNKKSLKSFILSTRD